jgi:hypothetical protein
MATIHFNIKVPKEKKSLTAQEFQDLLTKGGKPKRRKYNTKAIYTDEGKFDSQKELDDWNNLKLRQIAGEISELRRQVEYELFPPGRRDSKGKAVRKITYTADATYIENGKLVVVDSKAYDKKTGEFILTQAYRRAKKMMFQIHNIEIKEI